MNLEVKRGSERIKMVIYNKKEWNALRHCSSKGRRGGGGKTGEIKDT